jgi:hypothetical protein
MARLVGPLSVPCPLCGVEVGKECVVYDGRPGVEGAHADRWRESVALEANARYAAERELRELRGEADHVRVLRVIEYRGPRDLVERQVRRSIHGTIEVGHDGRRNPSDGSVRGIFITAVTLGDYPERLLQARGEVVACVRCRDTGKIANTADGEPWSVWAELPAGSNAAVLAGIVKPITCPACHGSSARPTTEVTSP